MDNYFNTLFERLRDYSNRENELVEIIEKAQKELESINNVRDSFVSYVSSEIAFTKDAELENKFNSIINSKIKNYSVTNINNNSNQNGLPVVIEIDRVKKNKTRPAAGEFNKTHFVLKQFKDTGLQGLASSKAVEKVENSKHGNNYAQGHVYNILQKLKERSLLNKHGENYVLTNDGIKFLEKIEGNEKV